MGERGRWILLVVALFVLVVVATGLACVGGAVAGPYLSRLLGPVTAVPAQSRVLVAAPTPTPMPTLQQVPQEAGVIVAAQEEVLHHIYESAVPSVVHIRVVQKVQAPSIPVPELPQIPGFPPFPQIPPGPREFYRRGEGSGFVWDRQGHIVTNNHVVEGSDRVEVIFWDGTITEAEVVGTDPDSDLAVIKVDLPADKLRPLPKGDSAQLKVGQMAVAIGNPFGQEFTMTAGIISALGRTIHSGTSYFSIPEVIQTDAPINPGNSGGPLLDRQGRVIGINTMIISQSGASAGIGFAVPINIAKKVVPALITEGRYEYAWLGISGATMTPELARLMDLPEDTRGALVVKVVNDSPADKAGLRGSEKMVKIEGEEYFIGGDVITSINSQPVQDMEDLITYLVKETRPGDTVELGLIREGGHRETVKVVLGTRPRPEEMQQEQR